MSLSINAGTPVTNATFTSGTAYTGYWQLGWGAEAGSGWADQPTSAFFTGDLSNIAVIPSVLTSTQIMTLYGESTQAALAAAITARAPSDYWPLTDSGGVAYSGTLPVSGGATTLYDASGNGDTGTVEGAATLGAAGPLSGVAVSLSGTTGDLINTTTEYSNPHPLSESLWFSTTVSSPLMSFTQEQTDSPTPVNPDRMLWIDPAGHLVFGVGASSSAYSEITSTGTYKTGTWYLATATIGASGMALYVNGSLVAQQAKVTAPFNNIGYWHLGYGYFSGWPDAPTGDYFTGSLAHAAIYPTQLTATQVTSLHSPSTVAGEEAAVEALSPTAYWPLQDGTQSAVCAYVELTVSSTSPTMCLYPVATTCPAPSGGDPITGITDLAIAVPPTTQTLTFTIKTSSAPASGLAGLQLLIPLTFTGQLSTYSATLSYPTLMVLL
jgi:hypothetical protein